jgi:hypothetical protein
MERSNKMGVYWGEEINLLDLVEMASHGNLTDTYYAECLMKIIWQKCEYCQAINNLAVVCDCRDE